jgi:HAD superfamily hydrolase (TIGR01549 family)
MANNPEAIFFDIGDTLVRGSQPSARRLLGNRLSLSQRETKKAGRLLMVRPCNQPRELAKALHEILPNHSLEAIESHLESLWREQMNSVEEFSGATSVLQAIKQKGIKIGVISNIWHPYYEGFCRCCREISDLLDYKILSYRLGHKKPCTRIYDHALKEAALPAKSCWMIGDTYELDMAPALSVGMTAVWLLRNRQKEPAVIGEMLAGAKRKPRWVVSDLEDILTLLH